MTRRIVLLLTIASLLLAACAGTKEDEEKLAKQGKLHYELGIDALNSGFLPKAFDELMQSDKVYPDQPKVQDALAYAWRLRGDLKKSEEYYKKSLRLDPKSPISHNNYASLLLQMQRFSDAEREARKALDDPRYPNQHLVYMNLGDALLYQGKFNEAITAYRQASTFAPHNPLPRLKEAGAYIRFERYNYAEALLQTMLRDQPDDRAAAEILEKLYVKLGRRQEARQVLADLIEKTKNDLDRAWAKDEMIRLSHD